MDEKTKGITARSIMALFTVYCLLLVLFPLGWLVLLGGAMLHPETVRKILGASVLSTRVLNKSER